MARRRRRKGKVALAFKHVFSKRGGRQFQRMGRKALKKGVRLERRAARAGRKELRTLRRFGKSLRKHAKGLQREAKQFAKLHPKVARLRAFAGKGPDKAKRLRSFAKGPKQFKTGAVLTGPKGGAYTIGPGGRKVYLKK